jgi:glycosyltransferase involved in cell wall biosynthesis
MGGVDSLTVAILIDTYNYARFVGRAIDSALQEDYAGSPIEILVIDDGSTDNTREVVGRYGSRVRYIAKNNGGQASALNEGLREAAGDIVCLLDGDDYFYPSKVRQVVDAFRRDPEVGLVYDEFDIVDSADRSLQKPQPEPTWTGVRLPLRSVPSQLRSLILLGHPWTCTTSAMSIRRAITAGLTVPEDVFLHSPDLFLGLVLPFLTKVDIIQSPATAHVYHGENVGLFRSSALNQSMYRRQMDYIRREMEKRFGVHFVRCCGRSIYDSERTPRIGRAVLAECAREHRQIASSEVAPAVKRRCHAKLAASLLLPDVLYVGLRELKAKRHRWQTRGLRRRISQAGR